MIWSAQCSGLFLHNHVSETGLIPGVANIAGWSSEIFAKLEFAGTTPGTTYRTDSQRPLHLCDI